MRSFTVSFTSVAVTAVQDLLTLLPSSSQPVLITGLGLSQTTRGGDAQEEILLLSLKSGHTTAGSLGTAPSPVANDGKATAFGVTARANDTTRASAGTIVTHYVWNWNVRGPHEIILPEPMQIILPAGRRAVFGLEEAPSISMTMSGYICGVEVG